MSRPRYLGNSINVRWSLALNELTRGCSARRFTAISPCDAFLVSNIVADKALPFLALFSLDRHSEVDFKRVRKKRLRARDGTSYLPRGFGWKNTHLPLAQIGVALFPAKESHRRLIFDILRAIDGGNDLARGTNSVTGTHVLGMSPKSLASGSQSHQMSIRSL